MLERLEGQGQLYVSIPVDEDCRATDEHRKGDEVWAREEYGGGLHGLANAKLKAIASACD